MRKLIKEADPDIIEEWKWMGPVWSQDGIICTGESYKDKIKLTFPKGASLKDPASLFNASLDGNARRAIDIHEGKGVDEISFKTLVCEAIALNSVRKSKTSKKRNPEQVDIGTMRCENDRTSFVRHKKDGIKGRLF